MSASLAGGHAEAVALVTAVVGHLHAGLTPEDVDAVRGRLSVGGRDPSPAEVTAELGRQLSFGAGTRPRGEVRRTRPTSGHDDPSDSPTVLVSGVSMPSRLSRSWPAGGPLWVRMVGAPVPDGPAVAVVGTRRPTLDGVRLAESIAGGIARAGVLVVSGLARGIDQAAHRGALAAGGRTTAVLGTGHGIDYPAGSAPLRRRIMASGGVLSEYAPDRGVWFPQQFTQRNRIIAGLVDAVVVVEAGVRSGALSTANWAIAMGRQVLVVPSSPSNAAATGSLGLLSSGATPVRGAEDVLDAIGLFRSGDPVADEPRGARSRGGRAPATADVTGLDPSARSVLALLGPLPEQLSTLSRHTGLSTRAVLVAVSVLEDRGLARRQGDGVMRG